MRNKDQGLQNLDMSKLDVLKYFTDYTKAYSKGDKRLVKASLIRFKDFLIKKRILSLPGRALKETDMNAIINVILSEAKMNSTNFCTEVK